MGTDLQGRDQFSRILYGAQISLQVGVVAVIMALFFGGIIGAAAGRHRGQGRRRAHALDGRPAVDPGILLAIGIVAWLDRGPVADDARHRRHLCADLRAPLRGSLLAAARVGLRHRRALGGRVRRRVLTRHMMPNALTPLIVQATLVLATAIIDIAGLGFLGLGPPDPRTPEWGTMLTDARRFLATAPWLVFFPGASPSSSAPIGFNLLGDGMRESLDPRLKR